MGLMMWLMGHTTYGVNDVIDGGYTGITPLMGLMMWLMGHTTYGVNDVTDGSHHLWG